MLSLADELGGGLDDDLNHTQRDSLELELEMERGIGGRGPSGKGFENLADEMRGSDMSRGLSMDRGIEGSSLADELGGENEMNGRLGSLADELNGSSTLSYPNSNSKETSPSRSHPTDTPRSTSSTPTPQFDRLRIMEKDIGDALLILSDTLSSNSRLLSLLQRLDEPSLSKMKGHGKWASSGSASEASCSPGSGRRMREGRTSLVSDPSPVGDVEDEGLERGIRRRNGETIEGWLQGHLQRLGECERLREDQVREMVAQVREAEGLWDELVLLDLERALRGVEEEEQVAWSGRKVITWAGENRKEMKGGIESHKLDRLYVSGENLIKEDEEEDELEPSSPTPQTEHLSGSHGYRHCRFDPSSRSPLSTHIELGSGDELRLSPEFNLSHDLLFSQSSSHNHHNVFHKHHTHDPTHGPKPALDLQTLPLLTYLSNLSESLHLNLAMSAATTRSLRGVRAGLEAWREREAAEDVAWEGVKAWEEMISKEGGIGLDRGVDKVNGIGREMSEVVAGFEVVLEDAERRMRMVGSVRG